MTSSSSSRGTKAHAEEIREECRAFLEDRLKLTLNMEKTHITHVDDGFVFLGHRIIRKRGSNGRMSVVTTIPREKAKAFVRKLTETLSGNHSVSAVDMIASLNRQLAGWAAFYKFTDFRGVRLPAHRPCRILENGALAGA
jgi:RNA-directed DNA polymerase